MLAQIIPLGARRIGNPQHPVCAFRDQAGINAKKEESNAAFLFFAFWVEGGTRTHDIQNHNLTL